MNSVKYIIAASVGAFLIGAPNFFTIDSLNFLFAVWFMIIQVVFIAFLAYGITVYIRSTKHRITASIKPAEAIVALARREAEIQSSKKTIYEEMSNRIKKV